MKDEIFSSLIARKDELEKELSSVRQALSALRPGPYPRGRACGSRTRMFIFEALSYHGRLTIGELAPLLQASIKEPITKAQAKSRLGKILFCMKCKGIAGYEYKGGGWSLTAEGVKLASISTTGLQMDS